MYIFIIKEIIIAVMYFLVEQISSFEEEKRIFFCCFQLVNTAKAAISLLYRPVTMSILC